MPAKFLLPCRCGRSVVIDMNQAGQQVTCQCGVSQEVPALRGIRKLAPADGVESQPAHSERPAWSQLQGVLFGNGAFIALLGLSVAVYITLHIREIDVPPPAQDIPAEVDRQFAQVEVDTLYERYKEVRAEGIGPYPSAYLIRKETVGFFFLFSMIAVGVAVTGVVVAASSFFFRSGSSQPPGKRSHG